MLLYNSQKRFVGIDHHTLRQIGYNNLEELREDVADFADLFEKRPGYIHNFKNFSWIDFLIHSDKKDVQAHIRCNGSVYATGFQVEDLEFLDSDSSISKGYAVKLKNLERIGDDDGSRPREIYEPELPEPMAMPNLDEVPDTTAIADTTIQSEQAVKTIDESETLPEIESAPEAPKAMLNIEMDTLVSQTSEPQNHEVPLLAEEMTSAPQVVRPHLQTDPSYRYDPSIAAKELGLPEDLISEFVGDFIVQAKKFRSELDEAIANSDFNTVQTLSHKLKGVAANLRIEDALEVLATINASQDTKQLREYTDYLYAIVHKLEFGVSDAVIADPLQDMQTPVTDTLSDDAASIAVSNADLPEPQTPSVQDDDIYNFDLIQNSEEKEQQYQQLSALADELSQDPEPVQTSYMTDDSATIEEYPPADPIQMPDVTFAHNEPPVEESSYDPVQASATADDNAQPTSAGDIEESSEEAEPFNLAATAAELGMTESELLGYVHEFVDQANELKGELENALKSRNFEQVKIIATELKGASEALHMDYASKLLTHMQTSDDIHFTIDNAKALFVFVRQL